MLVAAVVGAHRRVLAVRYVRCARSRRLLKFEEQFPEAIDLMARALRAGHAFTTGLQMVAEEMPEPDRAGVQAALRPAELRPAAAARAEAFRRAHAVARRAVLRDGGADAAGIGRQPVGGARQPGGDHPRAVQGQAAGARDLGARPHHRLGARRRCRPVALRCSSRSPTRTSTATFYTNPLGMQMIGGRAGAAGHRRVRHQQHRQDRVLRPHVTRNLLILLSPSSRRSLSRSGPSVSIVLNWSTPNSRADPQAVARATASVLTRRCTLTDVASPWAKRFQQVGAEVAQGDVGASAPAHRRRLSQPDGGRHLCRSPRSSCRSCSPALVAAVLRLLAVVSARCSAAPSASYPEPLARPQDRRFGRSRSATAYPTRSI